MMTMRPPALPPAQSCGPPAVPPQAIYSAEPASARYARLYVREATAYQEPSATTDALDTLELLASELVTNAIVYGTDAGGSLRVVVDASPGRCRIEVHDSRRRVPVVRPASVERSSGRGLFLVEAMAARWGVADRPDGKVVWAVVTW